MGVGRLMESELSPELAAQLQAHDLTLDDEVGLRRLLEDCAPTWTLIRLNALPPNAGKRATA